MPRNLSAVAVLLLVLFVSLPGVAQAPPSADAFVTNTQPAANFGSSVLLPVQAGTTSYIQLNLAALPENASVAKATLRLYVNAVAAPGLFDIYQVNSGWSEKGISFNNAPSLGVSATGGHPVSVTGASLNQFILVDITSLAQSWLDGSVPNQGIAIALTSVNGSFSFDSKESTGTSHQPELDVVFDSLATAPGAGVAPSQRSASVKAGLQQGAGPDPYVDNGTALQTGANFNIDGNGTAATFNATSQFLLAGVPVLGSNGTSSLFLGPGAGQSNTGLQNAFIGVSAGQANTTGNYNSFLGTYAGYSNTTGTLLTFLGLQSGYSNSSGSYNSFVGANSGYSNTTGSYNVFVGNASGRDNTTGSFLTFLGLQSGLSNTTGTYNSFMGTYSGHNNTTGTLLTFLGMQSGYSNSSGNYNSFVGANSGYSNTTGGYNVFVGNASGRDNTTGSFLTFMGLQSGVNNTTGNYNSFFGTYSGFNNTTGSNNTFLGYNAGLNANAGATNNVYISSLGASGDSGTIRIGDPANQSAAYMAGINGATTNAGVPVFVDSNGKLGTAGGGSFTISGNGSANSFNSATTYQIGGGSVLSTGSAADNNVFLGLGAGISDAPGQGQRNAFTGYQAGFNNTSGTSNTFSGYHAGYSNLGGNGNTFSGDSAGYSNTTGIFNTIAGSNAGLLNTSGSYNTISGYQAGLSNTTGNSNTFSGESAGYSNNSGSGNTFSGTSSGYYNTAGIYNSFAGAMAGFSNTTGNYNTFAGNAAGLSNTTGNSNIYYGLSAGSNNTTGNNNIDIGSKGCPLPCTESSTIRIGGDVGYGPQTAAYIAGIYGNSPTGALPVVINASGQLGTTTSGIGVTSFNGRTGAVVPAANDYNFSQIAGTLSFSQLSGTLGGSQLSGTYTNQLAFNNTSNSFAGSFAGNGSGLTGVTSGLSWPIVLESADYAIQASDFSTPTTYGNYLILTGSAAHTFNLPNPAPPSGNCVAIGNMASAPIASNLNVFLTVSANGLTVDGSALVATQPKRNSYLYCSDGTNYWRLDRQLPGLSEIGPPLYTIDTGTVNALKTTFVSGIDFGLIAGTTMFILPINANTSTTPTLNVNGLGAKTIVRFGNHPLVLGDLSTSALAMVIYDGSNWQLINPQTIAGTVASVTATAPLVSSGGATPNISCPTCVTTAALSGTTGSIGGAALTAGICTTGTAAVTGAVVGRPVSVSASDGSLPNGLIILSAAVTSANTVTVQLCATGNVTPAANTYNVTTQ